MAKIKFQMCIEIDDSDLENVTDDDLRTWLDFEMGKTGERRRLPMPLDRFCTDFTHKPRFIGCVEIERSKP